MKIKAIRSNWQKTLVLLLFGFPCFYSIDFGLSDQPFSTLGLSAVFLVYISGLILLNEGYEKFTRYLSFAAILALLVVLPQLLFVRLFASLPVSSGVAQWIFGAKQFDLIGQQIRTLNQLLTMLTVVPYGLFAVNSFSVADLLERAASLRQGNVAWRHRVGMWMAVLQHSTEVFYPLLDIWREEHPALVFPRHHAGHRGILSMLNMIRVWIVQAVTAWIGVCLISTLKPIPVFNKQIKMLVHK